MIVSKFDLTFPIVCREAVHQQEQRTAQMKRLLQIS
jgi:hypothetical protein